MEKRVERQGAGFLGIEIIAWYIRIVWRVLGVHIG